MHDYRSLIAPFIESIRKERTTDKTIRAYTKTLSESIDFLGHSDAPSEDDYTALKAHLMNTMGFAESTTNDKITLTRKFFTWTLKGEAPMIDTHTTTETALDSNEKAPDLHSLLEQAGTVHPVAEHDAHEQTEQEDTPQVIGAVSTVKKEQGGISTPQPPKSSSKPPKITIYPSPELDADIKDLARIDGLPVSTYILKLIEHDLSERKDEIDLIRRLRAKRA
ncbi:MAG: site-specific integrase [Synergistaceae bacterium]|nr:site-specific integrase [Synergistaceae bacterium]